MEILIKMDSLIAVIKAKLQRLLHVPFTIHCCILLLCEERANLKEFSCGIQSAFEVVLSLSSQSHPNVTESGNRAKESCQLPGAE